jgi:hypothetical protein
MDVDHAAAGARSAPVLVLHPSKAAATGSPPPSMQLSSRGPSGPGHRARLLSWKDHARRGRCGLPTRRAGAIRRPTPNTTPPPPSTSIRCHAYGEKRTEGRPRRAGARHPRQGDRSGRTSAVVSASTRHAFGVGATTRSPCSSNSRSPRSPGCSPSDTVRSSARADIPVRRRRALAKRGSSVHQRDAVPSASVRLAPAGCRCDATPPYAATLVVHCSACRRPRAGSSLSGDETSTTRPAYSGWRGRGMACQVALTAASASGGIVCRGADRALGGGGSRSGVGFAMLEASPTRLTLALPARDRMPCSRRVNGEDAREPLGAVRCAGKSTLRSDPPRWPGRRIPTSGFTDLCANPPDHWGPGPFG